MVVSDYLPPEIEKHIEDNLDLSTLDHIELEWNKRYRFFLRLVKRKSMTFTDTLRVEEKGDILLFTYSGSILMIGANSGKGRRLKYYSIKKRGDTLPTLIEEKVEILNDLYSGHMAYFDAPYIKNTSPIYTIAVTP